MKALVLIISALVLGAVYIRLAPTDAARWHLHPSHTYPATPTPGVQAFTGGAYAVLALDGQTPAQVLGRLNATALATPRTKLLAGSVAEGMITWETRSALWGFPDYTTAEAVATDTGTTLYLVGRLRFGRSDLGVNAARLTAWLVVFAP